MLISDKGGISVVIGLGFLICTVNACTQSGWSTWINDRAPSNATLTSGSPSRRQYGGDEENLNATARDRFCAAGHGKITNIVCVTELNDTDYIKAQGSQGISCRIPSGFTCNNADVRGNACLDYKIQFFCNCTNPLPQSAPGSGSVQTTGSGTNSSGGTGTGNGSSGSGNSSSAGNGSNGVTQAHQGNSAYVPGTILVLPLTSLLWLLAQHA